MIITKGYGMSSLSMVCLPLGGAVSTYSISASVTPVAVIGGVVIQNIDGIEGVVNVSGTVNQPDISGEVH